MLQFVNSNQIPNGATIAVNGGVFDTQGVFETVDSVVVGTGGTVVTDGLTVLNAVSFNNAGAVVANGTITSAFTQTAGTLSGAGTINGPLSLLGGTLSPGNSPGTMSIVGNATWAGGANYLFEINDALGTSGSDPGWDLLDITGSLAITASAGNEFTLDVDSLLLTNTPGDAANFNPASNYAWTFASAAGGIVGFNPLAFILDLSGFTNLYTGVFSVAQSGNNLNLVYTAPAAVPEPGTLVIWTMLGAAFWGVRRWRQQRACKAA